MTHAILCADINFKSLEPWEVKTPAIPDLFVSDNLTFLGLQCLFRLNPQSR